jgi:hypothetical protein
VLDGQIQTTGIVRRQMTHYSLGVESDTLMSMHTLVLERASEGFLTNLGAT